MTKSFRFSCRVAISFVVVVGTLFPGCTPSRERAPTEANQPPIEEGYFPGADGVRLFYRKVGTGPETAVYLHGGPWDMSDGGYELDELAHGRALIAFDQRSGGRSDLVNDESLLTADYYVRDLEALRQHFGLERMALIGQSWGAGLAALYTMEHSDRVDRLLLLSPMPPAREPFEAQRRDKTTSVIGTAGLARMREIARQIQTVDDSEVKALCEEDQLILFRAYLLDVSSLDRMRVGYCEGTVQAIRHIYRSAEVAIRSLGNYDFRPGLRTLRIPALVVEGAETQVPLEATREWAAAIPDARLLLVPGASHIVWLEGDVDSFLSAANQFLGGQWPTGAEVVTR